MHREKLNILDVLVCELRAREECCPVLFCFVLFCFVLFCFVFLEVREVILVRKRIV